MNTIVAAQMQTSVQTNTFYIHTQILMITLEILRKYHYCIQAYRQLHCGGINFGLCGVHCVMYNQNKTGNIIILWSSDK
jgi:hypothetical protein